MAARGGKSRGVHIADEGSGGEGSQGVHFEGVMGFGSIRQRGGSRVANGQTGIGTMAIGTPSAARPGRSPFDGTNRQVIPGTTRNINGTRRH